MEDQELNPHTYAEQFADPDASRAQSAEELLGRARMILATELGKDPLLRQRIREAFKNDAVISVLPTERGVAKIDEFHPFFVGDLLIGHERLLISWTELQVPAQQASVRAVAHSTISAYIAGGVAASRHCHNYLAGRCESCLRTRFERCLRLR